MPVTKVNKGTNDQVNEQPKATAAATVQAPTSNFLSTLLSNYGNNAMDAETDTYIQSLRKILEDPSNKTQTTMKKLTSPNGAVAFVTKRTGIVLLFTSVCKVDILDIKTSGKSIEAANSFKQMFNGYRLLNVIYVTKHDYAKYAQMACHIINNLQMAEDSAVDNFNVNTLSKFQISVDIEKASVIDFINRNSPHGVMNRTDFGFVLSANEKKDNYYPENNHRTPGHELLAVTGYTEFIETNNIMDINGSIQKFTPIIHISDIVGTIPTAKLLSLALPVAAQVFVSSELWKYGYNALRKSEPHPGNLIIPPKTAKPWFAPDQAALNGFYRQYLNFPIFVIDIPEGRARISGLEKFLYDSCHAEMLREFAEFLGISGFSGNYATLGKVAYSEVIGVVKASPAGYIDSRFIDYLYLVMASGYDPKFEEFKTRYEDIDRRSNAISQIAEFEKTNLNSVFYLNSNWVKEMGMKIREVLKFYNPAQSSIPTVNFDFNMGDFNSFSMMNQYSQGYNGNPVNIYG